MHDRQITKFFSLYNTPQEKLDSKAVAVLANRNVPHINAAVQLAPAARELHKAGIDWNLAIILTSIRVSSIKNCHMCANLLALTTCSLHRCSIQITELKLFIQTAKALAKASSNKNEGDVKK